MKGVIDVTVVDNPFYLLFFIAFIIGVLFDTSKHARRWPPTLSAFTGFEFPPRGG